jgi:hypothetical protein
MVKFDLYFSSSFVSNPEKIRFGINDTVIAEQYLPIDSYSVSIDLSDGNHQFWVELCDKSINNELRVNGDLVNDTFVEIKNIAINGSMMHYLLNDNGYVIPDWDHHKDVAQWFLENKGSVPEKLDNSKYLNLKGKYFFNFSLPIKEFLDSKIIIDLAYAKFYNDSLDRYQQLKNKILLKEYNDTKTTN